MASVSLRRLLNQVLPVSFRGAGARRTARIAGRKGTPRPLAVEQLEDRCLPSSTLQAISVPPPGQPPSDTAAGVSILPSVSADGRYVAFESTALNLVPGQTGGAGPNVFLLDRGTGALTLVSHLPGAPTTGTTLFFPDPSRPLLSRDGNYVVYVTGNDVIGQGLPGSLGFGSTGTSVVLYDRPNDRNILVSHTNDSPTTPTFFDAQLDAISPNGRYIVFDTQDDNLVPNEGQGTGTNLYLYDREATTQTTFLITHADGQNNVPVGYFNSTPSLRNVSVADDGKVVYLASAFGGQLINGQTGLALDNVYLYSPATQTNQLISVVSGGAANEATGECASPLISADGSTVVFVSYALNLVPNQNSGTGGNNVFRYRTDTNTLTLVSGAGGSASIGGNAPSGSIGFSTYAVAVNQDGRFIAFASQATNLVANQTGAAGNIFLYDAQSPSLTLLSGVAGSPTVGAGGDATLLPAGTQNTFIDLITLSNTAQVLSISDDGSRVAFVSQANNLAPGQNGPAGNDNLFLYAGGQTRLVTGVHGSTTATGTGQSGNPVLSGDGSVLVFHSLAADLGAGFFDANGVADVFAYDTAGPATAAVSRAAFQQLSPGNNYSTSVSADGTYTVFTSTAENLVPNQVTVNNNENVFLYQAPAGDGAGTIKLVNHVPGLPATTGDGGIPFTFGERPLKPQLPVISADGSTVAFTTSDDNLVPGEPPGGAQTFSSNVYLYSVPSETVTLVNHVDGNNALPYLFAQAPAVSADGLFVAYVLGFPTPGPSGFG
jgi:Tol biopolymer transport system component